MKLTTRVNRGGYSAYWRRLRTLSQAPSAKVSGLVSLTIFTVAFFGLFAILPTFRTIAELTREIDDAKAVNSSLAKKIKALENAEEVYSQALPRLTLIDAVVPGGPEFDRLAWQIQWLGADSGVNITSGSFGGFPLLSTKESSELSQIEMELTVQGDYGAIKNFLADLTKIDRLVAINEVNITSKGSQGVQVVTANIQALAYFLPGGEND
ncbi:MAG: hypothetical protein UX85_C0001G0064 [Candidatus Beckwithbacteria bacterium GW2011_GWB1_47_15]|uniref:Uncharacterized protein n=1 Tax=Candidatus Beckwithbacteria bacterium GW2011_GWB1_47_15 TaxID=1618371 RepID=A0A0G1UVV4_9BACT|nr:MAG: protein of unknown function with transmembrane region [Candidatus Beckwithbacteria bacterium GW2011_GWC1_49_16]AQS30699.1 hypothetical protein [uncultured bacterium]KKU35886.1 MAG: hypothetical protein UX50_C0001G0063 [Candidatus Beckwithbacteria bacterium GW2011_GWA1_46_30]KKU61850.1 MAG: hypothetical protein UX85_C0001G0064 [Candidatus Beckwithbacteria bacterium GW2011_GWB1_47_15]KKU72596.1 MAG: hypothetical protein UX97_C0001G0466 [Candidatus Beckwithbacteria bacterium GW2011_GWA2_47